jgi:pantetheine-phosphate adenylyltransferase
MTDLERVVLVGGTFSPVHNGHRALLQKAFQTASHDGEGDGHAIVGLTTDRLATETRSNQKHVDALGEFEERRGAVRRELDLLEDTYTATATLVRLNDPWGPGETRPDVAAVVASPESKAQRRAHELNRRRVAGGLDPIEIHTPPFVIAEDGKRISSKRIRNGEIDEDGRVLKGT